MKQSLFFTILIFIANFAQAFSMTCKNIDSYWEEDTLEFYKEGSVTYAYYFDNDTYQSVPCETSQDDGYLCQDSNYTIIMSANGYTTVSNGVDSDVEFMCF